MTTTSHECSDYAGLKKEMKRAELEDFKHVFSLRVYFHLNFRNSFTNSLFGLNLFIPSKCALQRFLTLSGDVVSLNTSSIETRMTHFCHFDERNREILPYSSLWPGNKFPGRHLVFENCSKWVQRTGSKKVHTPTSGPFATTQAINLKRFISDSILK